MVADRHGFGRIALVIATTHSKATQRSQVRHGVALSRDDLLRHRHRKFSDIGFVCGGT
jgi:hypothetical protein